jgi:hypothetical protein
VRNSTERKWKQRRNCAKIEIQIYGFLSWMFLGLEILAAVLMESSALCLLYVGLLNGLLFVPDDGGDTVLSISDL